MSDTDQTEPTDDRKQAMASKLHATLAPIERLSTEGDFAMRGMFGTVHRSLKHMIAILMGEDETAMPDAGESRDETAFSLTPDGGPAHSMARVAAATQAMIDGKPAPTDEDTPDASPQNAMIRAPLASPLATKPAPDPTLPPPSAQVPVSPAALENVSDGHAPSDAGQSLDEHGDFTQPAPGVAAGPESEAAAPPVQQGAYVPQPKPAAPGATVEDVARPGVKPR